MMHEVYSCDLQGKQSPRIKSGNNVFLVWKLNEEKKVCELVWKTIWYLNVCEKSNPAGIYAFIQNQQWKHRSNE